MAKTIMIQGTMSNAGKSVLVAGLCRVFKRAGYRVAPFKSQNMALNSFATIEGLEIGRAQAMQAEACGLDPVVNMNPVLLKPTADSTSQVIVNGKSIGNMTAREYFAFKTSLIPEINRAFRSLCEENEIVVIEGAGSPAEINLRDNDIVNMGLADMINAPVLLVGDIDRGGVFAQLYGTYMLLSEREKELLKGMVINKFRGDKTLLTPGIDMMKDKMDVPFVGVVPYMNLNIDDEDSLSSRFEKKERKAIDIVAIKLPHISNFTDLDVFEQFPDVSVRYITNPEEIHHPSMIVIPGSKNTLGDLRWLKETGLAAKIVELRNKDIPIVGICGGFQILGEEVSDPHNTEEGGREDGLGLLPLRTVMEEEKTTKQYQGFIENAFGIFEPLNGLSANGYEIHTGRTTLTSEDESLREFGWENVYGTYVHGIFDEGGIASKVVELLARAKGLEIDTSSAMSRREYKEKEYDRLADILEENMDMSEIYKMLGEANLDWQI